MGQKTLMSADSETPSSTFLLATPPVVRSAILFEVVEFINLGK